MNSKVIKRMESYRIRNAPKHRRRKLLLPVSCGVSSIVLLHILDQQLQRQLANSQGRTAYDLHVLLVHTSDAALAEATTDRFKRLRERYSRHTFTALQMADIFNYEIDIREDLSDFGIEFNGENASTSNQMQLDLFFNSLSSATSKADAQQILLTRLIVAFTQQERCEGILWGDSDSRLASKALANVAKGRGFSLPWHISDGPSPWGIHFTFPLRELFKSELHLYSELSIASPSEIIIPDSLSAGSSSTSIRNWSIDDLMTQYIESQGEKYPSIMANVVRTANKLQAPPVGENDARCSLCGMPIPADVLLSGAVIEDQPRADEGEIDAVKGREATPFCYGCTRTGLDVRKSTIPCGIHS